MKRLFLFLAVASACLTAEAQIPAVSEPVCAFCEARFTKGESHKPGCPNYVEEVEEPQSTQDDTVWDDPSKHVTDEFNVGLGDGRTCPECGIDHHLDNTNCGIARLQKSYFDWNNVYFAGKRKYRKQAEAKMEEITGQLKKRYANAQKNPVTPSTKLKDHQPMPEQKPAEPAEPRPKLDPMARPELPNSTLTTNVQETSGPNDPTIYDKRIEFHGDLTKYYVVARCKTSQDGKEEWKLFKKNGKLVAGPFSQLYVTDQGTFNFFVAADMNGRWGIYDGYGEQKVMHRFDAIVPLKIRDTTDNIIITFKCQSDGKWGLMESYRPSDKLLLPCDYDDILEYSYDRSLVWVEKNGLCGLAVWYGGFEVPLEYTYIENISYQKAGKYYIVSKDGMHYGAYHGNNLKIPLEYSLGEARQKVNDDASETIRLRDRTAKERAKQQNKRRSR